ncbi:RagB/SusD family nutrient uptake outer membrane protein [Phocaeicola plebeius]|uniref:RagB/SusD family nutrient uptake outer membrane protein n=1 Tax=Phocaeicola plebeius TaxID=310297 RepID=UPI0026EB190E|nr:RagB/SusD family nutrient uptake outer membrane protein [Phocaeicola plebeius]
MKALKYTIFTLLFGGALTSCNFLDKEPYQLTLSDYFNTADEANSFLTGIYAELGQSTFYGADYMYLVGGDDLAHYGGSGRAPATKGLICNNATTSDAAVTGFWYTLYSGINRANIFLENIDKVSDIDSGLKAQYTAEARFLRAFYYFNLVQCWGDVPFKTESTKDVVGLDIPRTDKQEIYDFIIKEMQEVSDETNGGLLTAAELNYKPGRVSKSAAWGILARVYLFRAGEYHRDNRAATDAEKKDYYQAAKDYALKVCTNQGHKLADDYWDYFIDLCSDEYNTTANESIWEAEFSGNNTTDVKAEGRIGNIIGIAAPDMSSETNVIGSADPGYSYEFIFATPKLYRLYCIEKPSSQVSDYMSFDVTLTKKIWEAQDVNDEVWQRYLIKTKDARFLWNIAPFAYVEGDGKNTGVTGRRFYESGFRDRVNEHDQGRSYSYGDNTWDGDEPLTGDYDYKSYFTKNIARPCAKFRREYEADKKDKNNTAINFPILRYSDVLLMVAEAENELNGATDVAYSYLNQVRERAGASDAPAGLSKDDFRQMVKDERARELCFEYTRHFDLIRWGEFETNMQALVNVARAGGEWSQGPSNVYTYFQVSSTYNYFPIPDAELAVNKAITTNNPGW